ncbi:hypothetical protein ED208_02025 [Stagnimonas aquatica]|uniref:OmpA-like domain-containing protein n=1 Tax=Stagnimonas aquatica TaxID=2689987 RepID=A0A3N0VKM9_9GAMM|nr:thrombospondin type 3 repeat-containing protein [Stagnimonas aquatica]ROH93323.1 hypothetical protein ED208_02025 [Stagnimonas aquatica]
MIKRARWIFPLWLLSLAAQAALPPLIVDGDGDGISDEVDDCPYTPPGILINERGCPLHAEDGDGDGVADPQDDCPYTPPGAEVDSHGCALDSDFDGVANGIDLCLNTALGAVVDARGCASGQTASARPPPTAAAVHPPVLAVPPPPAAAPPSPPRVLAETAGSDRPVPAPGISKPSVPTANPPPGAATMPEAPAQATQTLQAALLAEEQARLARPAAASLPAPVTTPAAPVPAPPEPPPPAPPLPESVSESLLFAARSAELSTAAARKLESLAPALRQLASRSAGAHLSIAAFADRGEGAKASQYAIQRSELVRAWLLAHGVPRERIRTSIRVLDSGEAAGNRRVEIRSAD